MLNINPIFSKLFFPLLFLLFLNPYSAFAQIDIATKFQEYLISNQKLILDSETKIANNIDSSWIEYHLIELKDSSEKFLTNINNKDTITLSIIEMELIISFFRNQENLKFSNKQSRYSLIDKDEVNDYLKSKKSNQVLYISKPLFIRNNEYAIIFYSTLCCGGIYGQASLSLYKLINNNWTKMTDISSGDF